MLKSNKKKKLVYLDYAASYHPNPSSIHEQGQKIKREITVSRDLVASVLGARAEDVYFTASGTEANNLAIQGVVFGWKGGGSPHLITTNIEHPSVLDTFNLLSKRKLAEVTIVPVEPSGIVDPKKIKKAIKRNTALISVMYANNEIGTVQPVNEVAREIRHFKKNNKSSKLEYPLLHVDAVQGASYLDLNILKMHADLLTLSGAKIEGGIGAGVLFKRNTVDFASVFAGGDQEKGLRPGTENAKAIKSFATSLKKAQEKRLTESTRLLKLQNYFFSQIKKIDKNVIINGSVTHRLPNNVNITFPRIPSDLLVIELSAHGIMASSKSACKSSQGDGSYVIKALRPDARLEIGGIRFSMGPNTKKEDLDYSITTLKSILRKLKKWYN